MLSSLNIWIIAHLGTGNTSLVYVSAQNYFSGTVSKMERILKKTLTPLLKYHGNHLNVLVIVIGIKEYRGGGNNNWFWEFVQVPGLYVELVHPVHLNEENQGKLR